MTGAICVVGDVGTRGEDCIAEATLVLILPVDDRILQGDEYRELVLCAVGQRLEFGDVE